MRTVLIVVAGVALHATAASSADATCSIPSAIVPQVLALCEDVRVSRRVPSDDWSIDDCASDFLQRGARQYYRSRESAKAAAATDDDIRSKLAVFDTNFPSPSLAKVSRCGDGTIDSEFGEECDDGNTFGGDGCSSSCQLE